MLHTYTHTRIQTYTHTRIHAYTLHATNMKPYPHSISINKLGRRPRKEAFLRPRSPNHRSIPAPVGPTDGPASLQRLRLVLRHGWHRACSSDSGGARCRCCCCCLLSVCERLYMCFCLRLRVSLCLSLGVSMRLGLCNRLVSVVCACVCVCVCVCCVSYLLQ